MFPDYLLLEAKGPMITFFKKVYFLFNFIILFTSYFWETIVLYSSIINGLNTIHYTDPLLKCFISKELINIRAQSICKFENIYIYVMSSCPHLDI